MQLPLFFSTRTPRYATHLCLQECKGRYVHEYEVCVEHEGALSYLVMVTVGPRPAQWSGTDMLLG